jgi:hypothetical protein
LKHSSSVRSDRILEQKKHILNKRRQPPTVQPVQVPVQVLVLGYQGMCADGGGGQPFAHHFNRTLLLRHVLLERLVEGIKVILNDAIKSFDQVMCY